MVGGRQLVAVDDVEEGRRDRIADFGVKTRSVGDKGGAVEVDGVGDSSFIGENKSKSSRFGNSGSLGV